MEEMFRIVDASGRTYKIYENGAVEGFDRPVSIFNRVPTLIRRAVHETKQRVATSQSAQAESAR